MRSYIEKGLAWLNFTLSFKVVIQYAVITALATVDPTLTKSFNTAAYVVDILVTAFGFFVWYELKDSKGTSKEMAPA